MKQMLRKNRIRILALTETVMLTLIYYVLWRRGYTHGISGYPEYLGYGRFVLMGVYAVLTAIFVHSTGGFRFGRTGNLSLILIQWVTVLAVNIITYFQLSLTAKELVAKRPMFDVTVVQAAAVVVFIVIVRAAYIRHQLFARMLFVGKGIETGTTVDGYRVKEVLTEYSEGELEKRLGSFDAVLIYGVEELHMYKILEQCSRKGVPAYVAQEKALIHGVNRGNNENGLNFVLVKGVGERWIDGILEVVRGYLIAG